MLASTAVAISWPIIKEFYIRVPSIITLHKDFFNKTILTTIRKKWKLILTLLYFVKSQIQMKISHLSMHMCGLNTIHINSTCVVQSVKQSQHFNTTYGKTVGHMLHLFGHPVATCC